MTVVGPAPATGTSGLQILTLVIAILGLLLAALGAAWQVFAWRNSGGRLNVVSKTAFPVDGANLGDPHCVVSARNVGRLALELTGWGYELSDGSNTYMERELPMSARLPKTLEPGHAADFFVAAASLRESVQSRRVGPKVRPWVDTAAHGKTFGKPFNLL